jgi:hypothetical protein
MSTTVTYQVSTSNDDGSASSTSTFSRTATSPYIGYSGYAYHLYSRFQYVAVPAGATIVSAKIQYRAAASATGNAPNTLIYFSDADSAVAPTTRAEFDAISLTSASVSWSMPNFTSGSWYDSPDIKSVVQEVVDRAGWESGNDMMLVHRDNGSTDGYIRRVWAYDGSGNVSGARLVIEYDEPTGGTPVTIAAATAEASAESLAATPRADVLVIAGLGEASAEALAANPTTALIVLGAVAEAVAEALPAFTSADVLVQASVAESAAEALSATAAYNVHVTVQAATAEASAESLPAEPIAQRNITVTAEIGTATAEALAAVARAGKKLYYIIKYQ